MTPMPTTTTRRASGMIARPVPATEASNPAMITGPSMRYSALGVRYPTFRAFVVPV
jgi:hypothetical protein